MKELKTLFFLLITLLLKLVCLELENIFLELEVISVPPEPLHSAKCHNVLLFR